MTPTLQSDALIKSQRRGALMRHPTLTGIDYIEVRRQAEGRWDLLVHFVPAAPEAAGKPAVPAGITPDNIIIRGQGEAQDARLRIVSTVYPQNGGSVLTVGVTSGGEAGLPPGEIENFPSQTLELVHLSSVDRFFTSAPFNLDVEAPSDLHAPSAAAAGPVLPSPVPMDYLAKDYESFRKLILDRMAVSVPGWTERNPVDLGMALVELLAYAGDYLSYYQDAVATEAYIGAARQRISVARHARLLDYRLHQGCNARVWVQVVVSADLALEAGTPLLTSVGGQSPRVPTQSYQQVLQQRPRVFETMHAARLFADHNRMAFYAWGASEYALPRGATGATLRGHFPNLRAGDVLIFDEAISPVTGRTGDADVRKRHPVRLVARPTLSTDPLQDDAAITEIRWAGEDALPFALTVAAYVGDRLLQDVSVALGNVVLADHGRTIEQERLPVVPEQGRYCPRLEWKDPTYRTPYWDEEAREHGAASALRQRPQDALPHISLVEHPLGRPADELGETAGRTYPWTVRPDLVRASRFSREFKVEVADDGGAGLLFGNGQCGQKPPAGALFTVMYRVGNGPTGNVGRGTITHIVSNDDGIVDVRNPLPAQGGTAPESTEEARLHAPHAFYVQERGVTREDYVAIAERHPEVQKAAAVIRWTGSWHTVFILVDRYGGRPIDQAFIQEFSDYIDQYRMSGYDLEIRPPRPVPLDIALTVFVEPGYFRTSVRQTLVEIFSNSISPDGQKGFFHPDNLTFGQSVYQSHVVTRAAQVPGVMRVDVNRFTRWGDAGGRSAVVDEIPVSPFEVARLDNDPSAPWRGTIRFNALGGW